MNDVQRKLLKKAVGGLIKEESLRLEKELVKVSCRLTMDHDAHVPDTLTRIRVLPTVAVVGQINKVNRDDVGKAILDIYIKFLPDPGSQISNLRKLGRLVKSLPGVQIVRYLSIGGKQIIFKGKAIVI